MMDIINAYILPTREIPAIASQWMDYFFQMDGATIVGIKVWWVAILMTITMMCLIRTFIRGYC